MEPIINKEVLSKILNMQVTLVLPTHTDNKIEFYSNVVCNYFINGSYSVEHKYKNEINTYEVAHECKEWARINYNLYIIPTFQCQFDGAIDMIVTADEDFINNRNEIHSVSAKTEPKAIFAACQWILDHKDK